MHWNAVIEEQKDDYSLRRRKRTFSRPNWSMSVIYLNLMYHIPLTLVPHLSDWPVSNDFGWINAGHHITVHAESGGQCWQLLNVGIFFGSINNMISGNVTLYRLWHYTPYQGYCLRIYTGAVQYNHCRMSICTIQWHPFIKITERGILCILYSVKITTYNIDCLIQSATPRTIHIKSLVAGLAST